jgi:hypothetical protein
MPFISKHSPSYILLIKGHNLLTDKSALNTKTIALSQTFSDAGYQPIITSLSIPLHCRQRFHHLGKIVYLPLCSSLSLRSSPNFISRHIHSLFSSLTVLTLVIRLSKSKKRLFILFDDFQLSILLFKAASWFLPITLILDIEEWSPSKASNKILRIKAYVLFLYSLYLSNAVLAISLFLKKRVVLSRPGIPIHVLPPLAFAYQKTDLTIPSTVQFSCVYVGHVGYRSQLATVINGFTLFINSIKIPLDSGHCILNLVLYGLDFSENDLCEYLNLPSIPSYICISHSLSDDDFSRLLHSSTFALCPLSDTTANKARFPQKLADYCSVGAFPLVSPVGDIPLYFQDNISALFLHDFTSKSLAKQILNVYNYTPRQIASLKYGAYDVYLKYFSVKNNAPDLKSFLHSI